LLIVMPNRLLGRILRRPVRPATFALRPLEESRINRRGLSAGSPAPGFELPDLDGVRRSSEEFRGKRVLLLFSAADCIPCDGLAPDLAQLQERPGSIAVVMVARGDADANRAKALQHGYRFPILLQPGWQVSKLYGRFATPVAYVIDEDGVLETDALAGVPAIRRQLDEEARR
jgi:peroxiredoxin